jgi:hypothetical protein
MHGHELMEGKCMKPRKQNNENKIKKGKKHPGYNWKVQWKLQGTSVKLIPWGS